MIPKDRPVTGHDLEDLREKLALSVTDLCWLFGLSMPNWGKIKKAGPEPVKDPAVALLARFLDSYPEACPIPRPPEPGDVAERLPELSRKTLGIALGREASAGYRWVVQGGRTSPILNRLLLILSIHLDEQGTSKAWQEWHSLVSTEATARGIENIWRSGSWRHKPANDG